MTCTILFLASNPLATSRLDLEEELRVVENELRAVAFRDEVLLVVGHAVRPDDLVKLVREKQPTVVHFSGHGSTEGICLRDDAGDAMLVSGESLQRLFRDRGVELVVLNACFSQKQALTISKVVPAVVGTTSAVGDHAARHFSAAFYRTIGNGLSIKEAFRDGSDAVAAYGLTDVFCTMGDQSRILCPGDGHRQKSRVAEGGGAEEQRQNEGERPKSSTTAPRWYYVIGTLAAVGTLAWAMISHSLPRPVPAITPQPAKEPSISINVGGTGHMVIGQVTGGTVIGAQNSQGAPQRLVTDSASPTRP